MISIWADFERSIQLIVTLLTKNCLLSALLITIELIAFQRFKAPTC